MPDTSPPAEQSAAARGQVAAHGDTVALASGAAPLAASSAAGGTAAATASFWRDPGKRAILWQALVVAALAFLIWRIVDNTATNMAARGLASGFGFLDVSAGFGIITTPFVEYSESSNYFTVFLVGLVNTIIVALVGCLLALALGFVVGIARLSSNWLVQKIATFYIELFRNVPLLLQILFWYSAVLKPLPGRASCTRRATRSGSRSTTAASSSPSRSARRGSSTSGGRSSPASR